MMRLVATLLAGFAACSYAVADTACEAEHEGDSDELGLLTLKRVLTSQAGACPKEELDVDVVVVGAGLSGLSAARELEKNGLTVKVVEAMNHIGGRMRKKDLSATQSIDFGGQWLGETHYEFQALLKEFGLGLFLSPGLGDGVALLYNGSTIKIPAKLIGALGELASSLPLGLIALANISKKTPEGIDIKELSELMEMVPDVEKLLAIESGAACLEKVNTLVDEMPNNTWPYELPEEWLHYDTFSWREWIASQGYEGLGKFICELGFRMNDCGGANDGSNSMLQRLWTTKHSDPREEELRDLIHGGAGQVPALIVKELGHPVELGDPVSAINQPETACSASVHTVGGKVWKASHVVVAVPPAVSGKIFYSPPLSWQRAQLDTLAPSSLVMKILIEYPTKIWDVGVFSISIESGFLTGCVDSTDPRSDKAVVACLVTGDQYDNWSNMSTVEERDAAVVKDMGKLWGEEAAKTVLSINYGDWPGNPWVQGGYGMGWQPNAWTRYGRALTEPHGAVQWASAETSHKWVGYFEGAIITGKRAAQNILDGKKGKLAPKIPSGDFSSQEYGADKTSSLW